MCCSSGRFFIWTILLVLVIVASLASDRFLTPFNLERVTAQLAALALVAIGLCC